MVSSDFTLLAFTDTLLEKMQAWSSQVYGDMSIDGLESMHYERLGDVGERLEALSVTKRFTSTGKVAFIRDYSRASADE